MCSRRLRPASQSDGKGRRHGHTKYGPSQCPQRVRRSMPAGKEDGVAKAALKPRLRPLTRVRHRDGETNNKANASEVPIVACPRAGLEPQVVPATNGHRAPGPATGGCV
jgi:hypothetical protein